MCVLYVRLHAMVCSCMLSGRSFPVVPAMPMFPWSLQMGGSQHDIGPVCWGGAVFTAEGCPPCFPWALWTQPQ